MKARMLFPDVVPRVVMRYRSAFFCVSVWLLLVVASCLYPSGRIFVGSADQMVTPQFQDSAESELGSGLALSSPDYLQLPNAFLTGVSFPFQASIEPIDKLRLRLIDSSPQTDLVLVVTRRSLLKVHRLVYRGNNVLQFLKVPAAHAGQVPDSIMLDADLAAGTPTVVMSYTTDAAFCLLFIVAALLAFHGFMQLVGRDVIIIPATFVCVAALTVVMAYSLPLNHAPDEYMHFPSYFWYTENLRPPSLFLKDPIYLNPIWFSNYVIGASADISYLLTARLSTVLIWVFPSVKSFVVFRLAQLVLLAIGFGLLARYFKISVVLAGMLCWLVLPQIAYVSTYLNGDILSFMMGLAAVALILKDTAGAWHWALALTLLLNAKSNYLVVIPLLPLLWGLNHPVRYPRLQQLIPCLVLAPLMLYRRIFNLIDQNLADSSYVHAAHQLLLKNTDVQVSPYSIVDASYGRIAEGVGAYDWSILLEPAWYLSSLYSLFGVFGYLSAPVPVLLLLPGVIVFIWVLWMACQSYGRAWLIVTAISGLVLAASLYYSISEGYQAQGRYLFPAVCIVFLLAQDSIQQKASQLIWVTPFTLMGLGLFLAR